MTKADRIRELAKTEPRAIVIADAVRCSAVILRQRINGKVSIANRNYNDKLKRTKGSRDVRTAV